MFEFLQYPHLAISCCATSVSEVKASSSVWLLDRVYKRNWFSKASLKVALWEPRQKSVPTSKTAFVWHIENTKGNPVICQSIPQSPPWGAGECFYSWFTGKKQPQRSWDSPQVWRIWWQSENSECQAPCLWCPCSACQASHLPLRQSLSSTWDPTRKIETPLCLHNWCKLLRYRLKFDYRHPSEIFRLWFQTTTIKQISQ